MTPLNTPGTQAPGPTAGDAGTPGRRELNRTRLRHNVHATAWRLVNELGYAEVTVEDIAAGAGISVATFYRHFSGKDDVVTRRWLSPERYGYLVDRVEETDDLASVVDGLFRGYASAVQRYDVSLLTRLRTIHLDNGLRLAMARGREEDVQTLATLFGRVLHIGPDLHAIQLAAAVTITARSTTMSHWAALDASQSLTQLLEDCALTLRPTLTLCQSMALGSPGAQKNQEGLQEG